MDNNLRCPVMGGEPCMGRYCACAVTKESTDHRERIYGCGLARTSCKHGIFSQIIDSERTDV